MEAEKCQVEQSARHHHWLCSTTLQEVHVGVTESRGQLNRNYWVSDKWGCVCGVETPIALFCAAAATEVSIN